jgi:ArsR family transcriptional regulator, lead/cadmium/zinc/bismuth-responsive transcriptional repressor
MQASELTDDQIVELAEMFRLMGDPSRLKIIAACLGTPMYVSDIAAKLGLSQPLVSHHLRLLRAARVLRSERRGKQIFYVAADEHVKRVINDMADHVSEHPASELDDGAREDPDVG